MEIIDIITVKKSGLRNLEIQGFLKVCYARQGYIYLIKYIFLYIIKSISSDAITPVFHVMILLIC